jgi:uncharacterized protein
MSSNAAHDASMLLAFRAENVRSFRNEFELSLLATSQAEAAYVREIDSGGAGRPLRVLPTAGIFGANASGKSNVLEAMDDMRVCVLHSFRHIGQRVYWPFRLDPQAASRPSRYEIDLILEGVRHEYGFVLDQDQVIEEWAYRYPHGRAATIFHRTGERIETGVAGRRETRAVQALVRPDSLLLSAAAAANHSLLVPLYDWFRRNLLLAHERNRANRQAFTIEQLDETGNGGNRKRVLDLLRAADLGIVDVKEDATPIDPRVREMMTRAIREVLGEEAALDERDLDQLPEVEGFGFKLVHHGAGEDMELDPRFESRGTLVWLGLVGAVMAALRDGAVLLADELDAGLHPALVAELVRLFQDPHANRNRAQLIFNSHDATVLGDSGEDRLLGRDQIWLTEKLADGDTRLYPLTDLRPRKHEAVGRRYLDGRYGATPILSRRDFDRIVSVVDE